VLRETENREFHQFLSGVKFIYASNDRWVNNLNLFLTHIAEDISSPGVAPGVRDPFGIPASNSDSNYTRIEAEYITVLNISPGNNLSLGLDTQYERGKNTGTIFAQEEIPINFKEERFTVSPLLEFKLNIINNTIIFVGARLDYTEDFGTEFSPHAGIHYNFIKTGTTFSANWGEGFKLPSFFALGNSLVGNENLKPETSSSFDLKIEQLFFDDSLSISGSLFYNNFINLIDFDEGPPPRLLNLNKVVTKGLEVGMKTKKIFNTVFAGNFSYINSDIVNSEENLRNRPEWLANFTIIWTHKNILEIYTNINYVGKFFDSSIPTGELLIGDYVLVDSAATIFIKKNFKFYIEIENLLNQKYQQVVGFDAPGIRPGAGIQWSF
jgi:outer membrane cobalamin receptor